MKPAGYAPCPKCGGQCLPTETVVYDGGLLWGIVRLVQCIQCSYELAIPWKLISDGIYVNIASKPPNK